ncbi:SEL1-like repeat protein [Cupriavidus respiraculi]|uniref:hypothetical protein n=1 Tax=Cupriavidus respiraculi TaxID=195930 RepID=UPI001C982CE8|nr:hypothetical protein [Cupriavidus respiraculi]MBY4949552.1 hypothetical protein [Cupriavidus respiraculi]
MAFLLGGCSVLVAGTMTLANGLDQSTTQSTVSALRAEQVRDIKALQAAGDPMGDYFFALANAEGWIGEGRVADPLVIMDMYSRAADRGSSDAMIALGLMLFDGRGAPQYTKGVYLPREKQDWKRGLELVERGMRHRCSYAQPLYSATTSPGRRCVVYRSPAEWIWPDFRDGRYKGDKINGYVPIIEKNKTLEDEWRDRDVMCKISREVRQTERGC